MLGYADGAYWLDVGTPGAFVQGSCDLVLGRLVSPALPGPAGSCWSCNGAVVAPEAKVSGGTAVGAGAVVESGATVGRQRAGRRLPWSSRAHGSPDSVVGRGARHLRGRRAR